MATVLAATGVFFATTGLVQAVAYQLVSAGAVVVMFLGARGHRPLRRTGWLLIATGVGAWSLGDLLWAYDETVRHVITPFPSTADVFYLAGYLGFAAGIHRLSARGAEGDEATLDAATLTLGVAFLMWVPVFEPLLAASTSTDLGTIVSIAYPLGSLLLTAMGLRLFLKSPRRPLSLALVVLAVATNLVADSFYAWLANIGTYRTGHVIDGLWIVSYLCLGLAALHPSMAAAGAGDRRRTARPAGNVRLGLLWCVVAEVPLLLWWVVNGRSRSEGVVIGAASLALLLVMLRMSRLMRRVSAAASHDLLTGLANRDAVERALERSFAHERRTAVLFLDVDRFKHVNDTLGHRAGDRLLLGVANRLSGVAGPRATVGRFGGDEFVVAVDDLDGRGLVRLADAVVETFAAPFLVAGTPMHVSGSVGVAIAVAGDTPESLLANADAAMYAAKAAGKGRWHLFSPAMRDALDARMAVEQDLHRALDAGELVVHYQPVIDLSTGRVRGVEALVRWQHPVRGLLPPKDFIGIAEETGLISALGRQVLREATRAVAGLPGTLTLAVNVSGHQFETGSIADDVVDALAVSGLPAERLVLEITESVLLEGAERVNGQLAQLQALGVRLAIDDFGTGFSSFSRLRDLPASSLKIDQAFVQGLGTGGKDDTIIAGLTYLAHGLGLEVVAEGVETTAQHDHVRRLGCDTAQGFLWSEALPLAELRGLVSGDAGVRRT